MASLESAHSPTSARHDTVLRVVRIATLSKVPAVKYYYEMIFIVIGMARSIRHHHNMKVSVVITLAAQALFTTAAAAVVARVPVDEILIRGDPPPYRPAHDK